MQKYHLIILLFFLSIAEGFLIRESTYTGEEAFAGPQETIIQETVTGTQSVTWGAHSSYTIEKTVFDHAYVQAAQSASPYPVQGDKVNGMIVPHHLLAAAMIADAFNAVATDVPRTVLLISPNHFAKGRTQLSISNYNWTTPYGILETSHELVGRLVKKNVVRAEEDAIQGEHGISGIVPFIKKSIPNARVVTLMVKDSASREDVERAAKDLHSILPADTLVVGSFDFSHYLPHLAAQFHDEKSVAVLHTLDTEGAAWLDIDSQPGLQLMLTLTQLSGALQFSERSHSSSARMANNFNTHENTSYFTGFYSQGGATPDNRVTLHLFGDIMLDRKIRKALDTYGSVYPFQNILRFMQGADVGVANLEGPFTHYKSVATSDNLVFTFDPAHAATLKKVGIDAVSLANNHTANFGKKGLDETYATLKKEGIAYFGSPSHTENLSTIVEKRGRRVGLIGFHQFGEHQKNILEEIIRVRPLVDALIVYPHWGAEYITHTPSSSQVQLAHTWIDNGADMVIGHHPHVVQPFEIYKGKFIAYSLGNFIFDQQFSEDVKTELSLGVVIEPDTTRVYLFPMYNSEYQVTLATPEKRDILFERLAKESKVKDNVRQQIREGRIVLPRQ